jgi:OOP family OmpA-OmpF porin
MGRIVSLLVALFVVSFCTVAIAQDGDGSSYKDNLKLYKYKKHQSEIGLHAGYFAVIGDVTSRPGFGVGAHFRRALDYAFSYRVNLMYGQATGQGGVPNAGMVNNIPALEALYGNNKGSWVPNYQTTYYSAGFDWMFNLNTFNFNNRVQKWNFYLLLGTGINWFETYYDAADGNGDIYDFATVLANNPNPGLNANDRKAVRQGSRDLLDGDYETRGELVLRPGETDLADADNAPNKINFQINFGGGFSYKFSDRFNLSLETQLIRVFGRENDLLDGNRWDDTGALSSNSDLGSYTNLRFNFALGKKGEDRLPPLYWTSPMDLLAEDVADVAERVDKSLRDSDGDGVFDMFDQEADTPEGVAVDTRGVTLDSDADGVPNYNDKEPFSPPGYEVDANGVAQVPDPGYTTEDDVNRIVDAKLQEFLATMPKPKVAWFMPLINFSNNSYTIRKSEYGKMHQVASVLQQQSDARIVVTGYADRPASECYNQVLSYNRAESAINYLVEKYGVARSRFILNYQGEEMPIMDTNGSSSMNRRVEFRVATDADGGDMSKPDCGVEKAGRGKKADYSGENQGY